MAWLVYITPVAFCSLYILTCCITGVTWEKEAKE